MNPDTGHIVSLPDTEEMMRIYKDMGYEPIPEELQPAANKKLAGQNEAFVSLTSGGKLSKWAADKRKIRRKMARESRKRNRR